MLAGGERRVRRRGVPHTFWNPGPGPARDLLIMTPNAHRLIQAIRALPGPGPRGPAAVIREHRRALGG